VITAEEPVTPLTVTAEMTGAWVVVVKVKFAEAAELPDALVESAWKS
jgi:hypothetical protein